MKSLFFNELTMLISLKQRIKIKIDYYENFRFNKKYLQIQLQ